VEANGELSLGGDELGVDRQRELLVCALSNLAVEVITTRGYHRMTLQFPS
jgi:hypothetical protein